MIGRVYVGMVGIKRHVPENSDQKSSMFFF